MHYTCKFNSQSHIFPQRRVFAPFCTFLLESEFSIYLKYSTHRHTVDVVKKRLLLHREKPAILQHLSSKIRVSLGYRISANVRIPITAHQRYELGATAWTCANLSACGRKLGSPFRGCAQSELNARII